MKKNKMDIIEIESEGEEVLEENENDLKEEDFNIDTINERFNNIMSKLESINIEKEIGEKEKNKETRIIIDRIELDNFKSYANSKKIGPLHNVK